MNCEQVQTLLVAYLDGEVTPSEKRLIQSHLSNCTVCQQELSLLSTARSRIRSMLQRHADHVLPSAEAWNRLEAKLTESAQPPSQQPKNGFKRLALGVRRILNQLFSGGVTMQKRKILATGISVLTITVVAVLIFNNVTSVSAQQIIERASAAQARSVALQGVQHTLIEIYSNPQAVEGAWTTILREIYADTSAGNYRYVDTDENGKVVTVSANDETYEYIKLETDTEIHRTRKETVEQKPYAPVSVSAEESLFEQFRSNSHVELVGKEKRDGRDVYVLANRNFQTQKLSNGQEEKTYTGTVTMVFDAKTYDLLESETTTYKDNKEVVIEKVRFLVDETLPAGTTVFWDMSDLKDVTIVDDEPQTEQAEVIPTPISRDELAKHLDTYALKDVPDGFAESIIAAPNQPEDQPYTYEINYDNAAGENFGLMAIGAFDENFVKTNFYDGSYKSPNGMVLYYSTGRPENESHGTSAILATPDGVSFLLISTMPREQVQDLVENLVRLK
jgi:anti-sigma factor RsiW